MSKPAGGCRHPENSGITAITKAALTGRVSHKREPPVPPVDSRTAFITLRPNDENNMPQENPYSPATNIAAKAVHQASRQLSNRETAAAKHQQEYDLP